MKNILKQLAPYRRRQEIATSAAGQADLYDPHLSLMPTVHAAWRCGLAAYQPPAYQLGLSWQEHQQQLLRVISLFEYMGWPFAITPQTVKHTSFALRKLDEAAYAGLCRQKQEFTSGDRARVSAIVNELALLLEDRPPDEARAFVVDAVAVLHLAPYTDAIDQIANDDEAARGVISSFELAFNAALLAGQLWDQR